MEKEKTEDQSDLKKDETFQEASESETTTNKVQKDLEEQSPEEKIKELEEKIVRQYAEMENQRRRYEKEKEDAFEYGGFAFAKETLNLIDNLERSKSIIETDDSLKNSEGFKKIISHLDIIYKDMISILKKNNIYEIEAIGKKLDPNLHQAMMEIEDEGKDNGVILQEIQKGFMMKERLLRPSLVGVSKKTTETKDTKSEKHEQKQEKTEKK